MMGVSTGLKPRRPIKIEKPRPLKLASSVPAGDHSLESVLGEMEAVSQQLQSGVWTHRLLYPAITSLCEDLKMYGPQLETVYKDQLDKCYIFLRTGCREDRLSLAARYRLLEIIELRAMNWKPNQNVSAYYLAKLQHAEAEEAAMLEQAKYDAAYMSATAASQASLAAMAAASLATTPLQTPTTPSAPMFPLQHPVVTASSAAHLPYGGGYAPHPQAMLPPAQPQQMYAGPYLHPVSTMTVEEYTQTMSQLQAAVPPAAPMLSPGEVVRTSGKFTKHNCVTGKNSCKDEVVIRNQDSGKVMGIKGKRVHMIEELSETIISFQRVAPGARERLVQITGPTEDHINQAKQLIEDTIRRNASPVRETLSLSSGGSSVFSSSPLNGSNSSIASHDDDNNSLNGCKRGGLVYSLSASDSGCGAEACSMGDYRYTVTHNNMALRIAGSNLSMVRTAKLVLDEYFNGERNLSNVVELLSGDSSSLPSLTSLPSALPHSSPLSSPPLLVKPATPPATPPPSSTGSATPPPPVSADDNLPEGGIKGDESPKNGGVAILRQPLFPSSSKEAVEAAEGCSSGTAGARVRRAAFAKTSEERSSISGDDVASENGGEGCDDADGTGVGDGDRRCYSRQQLVSLSSCPASRLTPQDWAEVVSNTPELIKKGSLYQAGVLTTMNEHGPASINGAPTYLQPEDLVIV